jgi:hypothetical protein
MTTKSPEQRNTKRRRTPRLLAACAMVFVVAAASTAILVWLREPEVDRPDTDVPLGVEEAVIIRYSGPRLVARPYRRGASVNLRIAKVVEQGAIRVYDVRYVVNLPGEFDLIDYVTSADGNPIDDLPSFKVRGLTSLTKDIETRIQEIEDAGVHIWHWYYETLGALGVCWVGWLLGLIFVGRPKRPPKPPPAPTQPTIVEQIERYLRMLAREDLSVEEKARLEVLLLEHWRERLGLQRHRMAAACRQIQQSDTLGQLYEKLAAWLHNPNADIGSDQFLEAYGAYAKGSGVQKTICPGKNAC